MKIERTQIAGLTAHVVDRPDAERTAVLMHGFGAAGDDLVGLAPYLDVPARLVFPEAPLELPGIYGDSRAWWMIDFERMQRNRRNEIPDGLAAARDRVTRLVDELAAPRLVLGGFSQGAMLALDVSLHLPKPPEALVLLSGTLIAESIWQPLFARLAGVPVLVAHGRRDPLLPFAAAELLRDRLREAGAKVEWVPFDGAHEIPQLVVDAVRRFLQ